MPIRPSGRKFDLAKLEEYADATPSLCFVACGQVHQWIILQKVSMTHCQPRNRYRVRVLLSLHIARAILEIECLVVVGGGGAVAGVVHGMALAVRAGARRARYEEVAAAGVELDGVGFGRRADGERALPELAVVVVSQRHGPLRSGCTTFDGAVIACIVGAVKVRKDREWMRLAGVGFVGGEPVGIFPVWR